ncbi:hypothetical protein C8N35_111115 [Breoghania corrubedonensis]|uniref:Tetratricopeptide repeat protein n=1 Tax=Breoghania corrubedonensis TaxID=665038 RepID=A0A2T5UYT0_9HYPH|nr:hypothetical protein [Breoghania corrubedonensis]PTW56652.1 hypothetical protein C8N35_111115 [Breoghania corrubedonensis]
MDDILDRDLISLLADIGFIAGSRGMNDHARAIFKAICALRPDQEAGFLGESMVDILSGDAQSAITKLNRAPTTVATRTFLGIALIQGGNVPDGRETLQTVCQIAPETPFSRMAEGVLANM